MAVNKCNIPKYVLTKLNEFYWAIKDKNNVDDKILENFLSYLNCSTIYPHICYPDNCSNETINFICTIALSNISFTIEDRVITFYIAEGDLTNALPPLSYEWTYELEDFEQTGPIDTSSSILTLKEDKEFDLLVTAVSVTITDDNGCVVTKNCYFVKGEMECEENYSPCSNITNFRVKDSYVQCTRPSNLKVA